METTNLWLFFPVGYLFTVLIETPVLLFGLSKRHPLRRKLFAGLWLTACTYPIVILVLPLILFRVSRAQYLWSAEVFAPVAECALFWVAFGAPEEGQRASVWHDFAAIVAANLASFALGEALGAFDWFGLFG